MMRQYLPPAERKLRDERIVGMRVWGSTIQEISDETGAKPRTVRRVLQNARLTNGAKFSGHVEAERRQERNERIVSARERGLTRGEIATREGVDVRTVDRVLHAAEKTAPRSNTAPHPPELWAEVEAWLKSEQGSYAEAARTFGVSKSQTRRRFPDLGWRRQEAAEFAGHVSRMNRAMERVTYA